MPDTSMIHTLLADWDEERSLSREEAVEILDLPKEEMEGPDFLCVCIENKI